MKVTIKLPTGVQTLLLVVLDDMLDQHTDSQLRALIKLNEEAELYEACQVILNIINTRSTIISI